MDSGRSPRTEWLTNRMRAAARQWRSAVPSWLSAVDPAVAPWRSPDPPPERPSRLWPLALRGLALVLFLTGIPYAGDSLDFRLVPEWLGAPLVAAMGALPAALAARRPLRAWRVGAVLVVVVPVVFGNPEQLPAPTPQFLGFLAVLLTVALRQPRTVLLGVWAYTLLAFGAGLASSGDDPMDALPGWAILAAAILVFGYLFAARGRAERRRELAEADRAVLEERARIARELHDVVAHHMSVIAVQAETAPYRIARLSDEGRRELAEIGTTARAALNEMRTLLGVLRSGDAIAERAPQPGLDQLEPLLRGVERTGQPVEATIVGQSPSLPPAVNLSAYRIVQEALSNAVRHSPGAPVRVEIHHEPDRLRLRLRLRVTNGPPARPVPPRTGGPGHGLTGMRERAAMLGGHLSAGPTPEGGYDVDVTLPTDDAAGEPT